MIRENCATVCGHQIFRCQYTDPILKAKRPGRFFTCPTVTGVQPFPTQTAITAAIRKETR